MSSMIWIAFLLMLHQRCVFGKGKAFFSHAGSNGTELGRDHDDPNYYRTNSEFPILPRYDGYVASHGKIVNRSWVFRFKTSKL